MTARPDVVALRPWLLFLGFGVSLVAFEGWVRSSSAFADEPGVLATAITLDLVLGLPFLGWLLLVRTGRAPWPSLLPLALAGGWIASAVLPPDRQHAVDALWALLPLAELGVVAFLLVRAGQVTRRYRAIRADHVEPADALAGAFGEVLGSPRLGAILATEITLLRYGVGGWFVRTPEPTETTHRYHTHAGYPAVFATFLVLILVETAGVHLIVALWSEVAAWIVTGLSLYGALWLAGDFHAARRHPIRLDDGRLFLRAGLRWRVVIPLERIVAIHPSLPEEARSTEAIEIKMFGESDLWIEVDGPITTRGLFGLTRRPRWFGVGLEDPERLREALTRGSI